MEGQITFTIADIGYAILFIAFLAAVAYAILLMKNVNTLLKTGNSLLKENQDHLNKMIPNLAHISENILFMSDEMKAPVKEAGQALELITSSTKDTVVRFNETADRIGGYAVIIGEVAKVLIEVFSGEHKRN